jgi:hypothetical protein
LTRQRGNPDNPSLADHPGYLGMTSQGVIAIHADWPLYQLGHGVMSALESLGSYPDGTRFLLLSDIDRCALLVRDPVPEGRDAFDSNWWHAVAWHEDLLDASDAGYLTGVERLTTREHEALRRDAMRASIQTLGDTGDGDPLDRLVVEVGGEMKPFVLPPLDDFDEEDDDWPIRRTWLGVNGPIELTADGWSALDEHLGTGFAIPDSVQDRILPLLALGRLDMVIRELGAIFETRMRDAIGDGGRLYGLSLVDVFVARVTASGVMPNAHNRYVAGELRTSMKFVRNEFAHQLVDIARPRGRALVARMCRAVEIVEGVGSVT